MNCNCGQPDEKSPALHAGTCPVWAEHHNLIPKEEIVPHPRVWPNYIDNP